MTITLYELAGAEDDRRFSPFVWRVRMALAHKGLAYEGVPWRFTEKERIAFSGQDKVPVLVDGETVVSDSWAIAEYLEDAYPDRPSLFGGETGRAGALFVKHWLEASVFRHLAKLIMADVHDHLAEKDKAYFRESREARFGCALEEVCADPAAEREALAKALTPMRRVLATQPYLAGETPAFADYIPFAAFQWARCISPTPLLTADDPIHAWRERLLDSFDGMPRDVRAYPAATVAA